MAIWADDFPRDKGDVAGAAPGVQDAHSLRDHSLARPRRHLGRALAHVVPESDYELGDGGVMQDELLGNAMQEVAFTWPHSPVAL